MPSARTAPQAMRGVPQSTRADILTTRTWSRAGVYSLTPADITVRRALQSHLGWTPVVRRSTTGRRTHAKLRQYSSQQELMYMHEGPTRPWAEHCQWSAPSRATYMPPARDAAPTRLLSSPTKSGLTPRGIPTVVIKRPPWSHGALSTTCDQSPPMTGAVTGAHQSGWTCAFGGGLYVYPARGGPSPRVEGRPVLTKKYGRPRKGLPVALQGGDGPHAIFSFFDVTTAMSDSTGKSNPTSATLQRHTHPRRWHASSALCVPTVCCTAS